MCIGHLENFGNLDEYFATCSFRNFGILPEEHCEDRIAKTEYSQHCLKALCNKLSHSLQLYTILYFYHLQLTTNISSRLFHSCCVQGNRNTDKNNKRRRHRTAAGLLRPLNRGGRLIQVTNTAFVFAKNLEFKTWKQYRPRRPRDIL